MSTIVVSFRIDPEELAKALDGLLSYETNPTQLTTISNIVRLTFYHGIVFLCEDLSEPASNESKQKITQLLNQNKRNKVVGIKDVMKK